MQAAFKTKLAIVLILFMLSGFTLQAQGSKPKVSPIPSDLWAVKLSFGGNPNSIAQQANMENLGAVGTLDGVYIFRAPGVQTRDDARTNTLMTIQGVTMAQQQFGYPSELHELPTGDPDYPNAWHLENTGQDSHGNGGGIPDQDIDVQGAWDPDNDGLPNDGVSGLGVVVAAVDDGIQYTHPDLILNYRADLDYDYSDFDDDGMAVPYAEDYHGTAVSGIMTAVKDNNKCSTGIAYNANLVSLRLLGGTGSELVTFDAAAAGAFSHRINAIDIYNNSWGYRYILSFNNEIPLEGHALELGATVGRGGLGNIYVFSAGNNGFYNASTNHNPLTSTRYGIVVGGSNHDGEAVWYTTRGSGVFVNAPTAGAANNSSVTNGIFTTDMMGDYGYNTGSDAAVANGDADCASDFNGTSAAAPITSGTTALILEANPNLRWRDVKHILVNSSDKNTLSASGDDAWQTNAAGIQHSHAYGFGRVNAAAAVAAARTWVNVPQETVILGDVVEVFQTIPDDNPAGIMTSYTVEPGDLPDDFVVEHIVARINLPHAYAGDITAIIASPSGVQSRLLTSSLISGGFPFGGYTNNFPLMTVANWGESAADLTGTWNFHLSDRIGLDYGALETWQLVFYGYRTSNVLGTPGNFTAQSASESSITLNWLDNSTVETGYSIERTTAPGDDLSWTVLPLQPANTTSFTDTDLTACANYYYRARATDGVNYSSYSNIANARPQVDGGCPTQTLQLLSPAPNQVFDILGAPLIRFSSPQLPEKFTIKIVNAENALVVKATTKGADVADVCTGGSCIVNLKDTLPDLALDNGIFTVQVVAKYASFPKEKTAPVPFEILTPAAPKLLIPSYATIFTEPEHLTQFVWKRSPNASSYLFRIRYYDGTKFFKLKIDETTSPSIDDLCNAETCTLPVSDEMKEVLIYRDYYYAWTVTAKNVKGKARGINYFFIYASTQTNVYPYIYRPSNESTLYHPSELVFGWVQGTADTEYRLQIRDMNQGKVIDMVIGAGTSPSIAEVCNTQIEIAICGYALTPAQKNLLEDGKTYKWRIKSKGEYGKHATDWWSFTLSYEAPVPVNQLPVPNTITSPSPIISWSVEHPADRYTLTLTGGTYVLTRDFNHDDICQLSDEFYTCAVNFSHMPGTEAIIVLEDGVYTWYVSSYTGNKTAGSTPTTFTVMSGEQNRLSNSTNSTGGLRLPAP